MRFHVTLGDRQVVVELDGVADGPVRAQIDGQELQAELRTVDGTILLSSAGRTLELVSHGVPPRLSLWTGEQELQLEVLDDREHFARAARPGAAARNERTITSPMPGRVVKVMVGPGDPVERGQGLVIVEAMKMENELVAPLAGKVRSVLAEPGKTVESGQVLVELE